MALNFGKGFAASGNITDSGFLGGFMSCKAKAGTALYAGMPMTFGTGADAGLLVPVPDGALGSAATIVGVAAGFFWIDSEGSPKESLDVLSSQVSSAGEYNGLKFAAGEGVGVKIRIDGDSLYAVKAKTGLAIDESDRGAYVRVLNAGTDAVIDNEDGEVAPAAVAAADAIGVIVDVVRGEGSQTYGLSGTANVNDWGVSGNTVLIKLVNTVY